VSPADTQDMTRSWPRDRRSARRIALINAYEFPGKARQRFAHRHNELTGDDVPIVEAATRQWFRLVAGYSRARLSMPSVLADDLWQQMLLDTREYAAFCESALGRFMPHLPESATTPATAGHGPGLLTTFHLAQRDEGCDGTQLPLLFRVDRDLAVAGGRHYLADCGGRGECYQMRDTLCLKHLRGVGRPVRGDFSLARWPMIRERP
jgi:hypothetical protein